MFKREVSVHIGARGSGRLVAALAVSAGLASLAAFGAVPAAARHDVRGDRPGAEHRPGVRGGCNRTSITGRTNNGTDQPLFLVGATHGITNTWCSRPSDRVAAHSSNSWKAGDDLFGTEIVLLYHGPRASLGGNGIRVEFFARTATLFDKDASASCKFLGETVRPFRCVAAVTGGNGHHPRVLFGVFPKAARPGARGGCNSSSITGLTHNETDHKLTLVLARHGITNTWCTRPNPDVPAHLPSNRWKAGDDLFKTEVAVAYSFGHGIEVQFFAGTGPAEGGCGFLTPVPVPYGCEAKLFSDAPRHPVFVFTVFPKGKNRNEVNAQGQTGNR